MAVPQLPVPVGLALATALGGLPTLRLTAETFGLGVDTLGCG
jgi:hypothetical protein